MEFSRRLLFCRNRKASSSFNSKTSHFRSIIPTKDSRETKAFSIQLTLQMCSCIRGKLMEVRVWLFSGVFLWMIVTVPVSIHSELTNECRVGDFSFSSQFYSSFSFIFIQRNGKQSNFFVYLGQRRIRGWLSSGGLLFWHEYGK